MCSVVSESKVLYFSYYCSSQFCVTKAVSVYKMQFLVVNHRVIVRLSDDCEL